ncbi:MAG: hypothetical protein WD533_00430 [Dehalococcoidia bacterium]
MTSPFDPGDLWEAVESFVQAGMERLDEDRTDLLGNNQAGIAVVWQADTGITKLVYVSSEEEGGPVDLFEGGPDTLAAGVGEQFDKFMQTGLQRLDDGVQARIAEDMEQGAHLLAVLDLTGRTLKGVIVRESSPENPMIELFTLPLG